MQPYFGDQITSIFETQELTNNRIVGMQKNDKTLCLIHEHLMNGTKPDFSDPGMKAYRTTFRKLYIEDDVVMKRRENGAVTVIPEGEIPTVLRSAHGGPLASHYGISKSYYRLVSRFYFPSMVPRLTEFINSCEFCLRRKMPKTVPKPVIQPIEVDHSDIGGTISYDFKGPLPTADKTILYQHKSRYILVIIDHATRYVMAHPTPTMEAKVVSEIVLSRWIPCFGVPRTVISDRARSFTGTVMRTVYKALEVDLQLTAAYNPSCNGLVEQVNRNISSLLMIMLEEGGDDWPKKLNLLFSAYNASPQSSTGYSPNFLVYGRELIEPIDLHINKDRVVDQKGKRVLVELCERLRLRRRALELLQLKFEELNLKRVERSQGKADVSKFEVGELVGFKAPPSSNKLCKYFEINHRVIKVISADTYVIKNEETGFERIINARKMRKLITDLRWNDRSKLGGVAQLGQSDFTDDEDDGSSSDEAIGGNDDIGRSEIENREVDGSQTRLAVASEGSIDGGGSGNNNREDGTFAGGNTETVSKGDIWRPRLRNRATIKKPIRL